MDFFRRFLDQKTTKDKTAYKETQNPMFYRTCLKCLHSNPYDATECENCGTKLEAPSKETIEKVQHTLQIEEEKNRIEEMIKKLKVRDSKMKDSTAKAMREIGSPANKPLITSLIALNDSKNSDERGRAIITLGESADARVVYPLITAIKDPDSNVRKQAVTALGKIRTAKTIAPLASALRDSDENVRGQAKMVLDEIVSTRGIDPLVTALKDWKSNVREDAAIALGEFGDVRAIDHLINALKDSKSSVRAQVAIALGKIGDKRAVAPLITALKDSDENVRSCAEKALRQLDLYSDEWQRIEVAMRTKKPELAVNLGNAGIEPLIVALNDTDWGATAAIALGKIRNVRAVEPLIAALKESTNNNIRIQAAIALGEIGDRRAVAPLLGVLNEKDLNIQKRAVEALSRLGHEVLPPKWPPYSTELSGNIEVRVNNPNDFQVRVGIRSGSSGKDFIVRPNQIGTVRIPPGSYKVYFQYATHPTTLFQGNDIQLTTGLRIDIVKSYSGNYSIRTV